MYKWFYGTLQTKCKELCLTGVISGVIFACSWRMGLTPPWRTRRDKHLLTWLRWVMSRTNLKMEYEHAFLVLHNFSFIFLAFYTTWFKRISSLEEFVNIKELLLSLCFLFCFVLDFFFLNFFLLLFLLLVIFGEGGGGGSYRSACPYCVYWTQQNTFILTLLSAYYKVNAGTSASKQRPGSYTVPDKPYA